MHLHIPEWPGDALTNKGMWLFSQKCRMSFQQLSYSALQFLPYCVWLKGVDPASQLQEEQRPLVTDTSSINAQLGDLEGGGGGTEDQVRKRKDQDTFHK